MTPWKKVGKLKGWLLGVYTSKNQDHDEPPSRHAASGGFFENAERFVVKDSNMMSVRVDQHNTVNNNTVINVHTDHTMVTQIMSLLSQHIIPGAAHDSSARTPPPRCHPNTRVTLIARITAWFDRRGVQELILWLTGPAGVGKSAIVQTFAEYLVKSKSLGASVFISRPNKRNNPNGIFVTIAYQLATRIEAYRNFIVERISLDPELLRGNMEAQFTTFIVEPFVERKIGASGEKWGILLDGLDELEGEDAQCNIVHLISSFAHEHRETPLVWIISSRPESHISNTFDDDEVRQSCWTEYIPVDSTEACEDVERFFRSSFKTIQKKFRQSVPIDWPSSTDFLKLTAAASGLFVYAEVVMRFIRDPDHADPFARFEVLLSVIDRSTAVQLPTKENPFVHLDALYHEILSSIPSALWPAAKQLLGFRIHEQRLPTVLHRYLVNFATLRGSSILFSISQNTVCACLTKCRSAIKIPDWKVAHKEKLMFLHASFSDYLDDSSRSGDFHVGNHNDFERVVVSNLIGLWKKCDGDDIALGLVESTWLQYCSKLDSKSASRAVAKLHATLFRDIVLCVAAFPRYYASVDPTMVAKFAPPLQEVHMAKLCYYLPPRDLAYLVNHEVHDLNSLGFKRQTLDKPPYAKLRRETRFGELKFGHLDWKTMSPAKAYRAQMGRIFGESDWVLNRPRSRGELKAFVSELEGIQGSSPELRVVVFGGILSGRVAVFRYPPESESPMYYVIPYPE